MKPVGADLPLSDSPNLGLCEQTCEEKIRIWKLNGKSWSGRLSVEDYLGREEHLGNQDLTRDGSIAYWLLTDLSKDPNERPILSSCESLKKRALVKQHDQDVEEVISFGIMSVFCDPALRGRGYAARMMKELGEKLDYKGQKQEQKTQFTILYSDIGKTFYAKNGWEPYVSSHVSLPPLNQLKCVKPLDCRSLYASDLAALCAEDESMIQRSMHHARPPTGVAQVAIIPDKATMSWHHAREDYVAQRLLGRTPEVRGSLVRCIDGSRIWCFWSRFFGNKSTEGNILNILRLAVEAEATEQSLASAQVVGSTSPSVKSQEHVEAIQAILQAAQLEAAQWNMGAVQMWNPGPLMLEAAKKLDPSSQLTHRDEDSIASLKWHDDAAHPTDRVEWMANEKYAWC